MEDLVPSGRGDEVKIREILSKIRKGVKAGMAAATESNELNDSRIVYLIDKFMRSNQRKMMLTGEQYYSITELIMISNKEKS